MTVTLDSRQDFSLEALRRVAIGGEAVAIGDGAKSAMTAAQASFMALLDSDRSQFIYGTTSGGGQRAREPIPADQQRARARAMGRLPQGAGFGPEAVPERVVRMAIFARLANYIEGNAKARPVEAERIAALLGRPLPRLPLSGQVGAGEILPLFHLMSGLEPGDVEEGEPMARINGSPVSTALVADAALGAERRLDLAERVFALSIEAYNAPLEAYDPVLAKTWSRASQKRALKGLSHWLAGVPRKGRLGHQAPVSWRILPLVLAAAHEATATAREVAETALKAVTDNPVYVLPDRRHPLGRAFSTGGYHNAQAAPAIDTLNARFADLVTLADRHTMKLHEAGHLPESLAAPGSGGYGTGLLGFIQVGYGEEARHAAARSFLPPSEGGGYLGQNDVAVPTMLAYQKHRTASFCLEAALTILAVVASQALWADGRQPPPKLKGFLDLVRAQVPPLEERGGRALGEELERLRLRLAAYAAFEAALA